MAVMHLPAAQSPGWAEVPPESRAIANLRELRERIEIGKQNAEILEGRLVVSPKPVLWHEQACVWLDRVLQAVCDENRWFIDRAGEIDLPATDDLIEPDLVVLSDLDRFSNLESLLPLDHVLLVAEVVSRSSIREDRQVKPRACALAGIPLYVLVDRFTSPLTVSVLASPGPDGYATGSTVKAGETLRLPPPFDVSLDTATLPVPR